jgi:hypothetical protein
MSSPASEPVAPAPAVKEEDSIVADSRAPEAAEGTALPTVEDGLTKKDFDLMTSILHRITNFRDEEYVICSRILCETSKLTDITVAEIFPKTSNESSIEECFPTISRL